MAIVMIVLVPHVLAKTALVNFVKLNSYVVV